jgi:hypothetical protein
MNQPQEYPDLTHLVTRLMIIALMVATRPVATPVTRRPPLALGYRSWLAYQVVARRQGRHETLIFYVCPKGVATPDDEPFAVGTRFIMETYRAAKGLCNRWRAKRQAQSELVQVFVMQKYASLEASGLPSRAVDG